MEKSAVSGGGTTPPPPPSGEWVLYDDADPPKPIANFIPIVTAAVTRYTDGSEPESAVEIVVEFADSTHSEPFIVPMAKIEEFNWLQIPGCLLHAPAARAKKYLAQQICGALPSVPTKTVYRINKLGNCNIAGEHVYSIGAEVIRPCSEANENPEIELAPSPFKLDYDSNLPEDSVAVGMMELIGLFANAGRVMLAHTLLYFMSAVYADVWKFPCFCVFLYGHTDAKKTTTSAFLAQLYNRKKGIENPVRLNASIPAAVDILYEKADCVVVLDDLFPADSSDIRRKQTSYQKSIGVSKKFERGR